MLGLLIAADCATPVAPPIAAPAGPAVVRLAVAGGIADADPARWDQVRADIVAWRPDAMVWTGSLSATRRGWNAMPAGFDDLAPALAVPSGRDLRGDHRGDRFAARFASGERWVVDVPGWRLVGAPGGLTESATEAGFWLPRVLGPTADYGHAIAVLGGPPRSLVPDLPGSSAPRLSSIAREAAGGRLALVIGGGSGANELFLPDGAWGTALLVAGNAGGPGHPWPMRPVVGLQPDFARGVAIERARDGDERSPLAGWWSVELADESLEVGFRLVTDRGMREVVRGRWTADTGWDWTPR